YYELAANQGQIESENIIEYMRELGIEINRKNGEIAKRGEQFNNGKPEEIKDKAKLLLDGDPKTLQDARIGLSRVSEKLLNEYINNHDQKQDLAIVIDLIYNSASKGKAKAQLLLAFFYCKGIGIDQDIETASRWYKDSGI